MTPARLALELRSAASNLPRGGSLDVQTWEHRHRWLQRVLWIQAAAIAAYGATRSYGALHDLGHVLVIAVLGAGAAWRAGSRTLRSLCASIALLAESALVVHLFGGATEAHFHFFVTIAALALYEDALPYLAGVGYVVVEHGVVGAIDPHAVYAEASRAESPWLWGLVHGLAVLAAAAVNLVAWGANERVRGRLRAAEARQREERAHAERYLDIAGAMIVALDSRGRVRIANRAVCAALGYTRAQLVGRDWIELTARPADREALAARLRGYLAGGDVAPCESVVVTRDGRERRIVWQHSVVRDSAGAVQGTLSSGIDVSEQREAEGALEQERADLAALARVSRRISSDPDARQAVADAARQLAGAAFAMLAEPDGDGALVVTCASGVCLPGDVRIALSAEPPGAAAAYLSGRPSFVQDARRDAAATRELVEVSGAASVLFQPAVLGERVRGVLVVGWGEPVEGIGSREAALVAMLGDDAALAIDRGERQRQMELAATTDPLTGVANRRAWDEALAAELTRARADGRTVCVALVDLDRFKALNDERGHVAGDRTLKECAAAWRGALRPSDLLARIGGDEFAVLLPACELGEAQRIRARLVAATPHAAGCSVGLAIWDGAESPTGLLRRADRDLYRHKAVRSRGLLSDPQRLGELSASRLLDAPEDPVLARLTRLARRLLGVPVTLVSLVDADREFFASQQGLDADLARARETDLSHSFCQYAATTGRPLVVEDAREHPLVRDSLAVTEHGVRAYAGVPLTTSSGRCLGAFCAIDRRARAWSEEDVETLAELATAAVLQIERRSLQGAETRAAPSAAR